MENIDFKFNIKQLKILFSGKKNKIKYSVSVWEKKSVKIL